MIGYYNVSVILTYIGLASSVVGIFMAMDGNLTIAIFLLLFSGVCDMFDGKIARRTKRNDDEKAFGIQIDSLCDLVCFGAFPAVICHRLGVSGIFGSIILFLFVLAGVIRLGYFNVTEQVRQASTTENRKFYQGLPITSSAVLLPLIYLFRNLIGKPFPIVLGASMFLISVFYIANIKVKKPGPAFGAFMIVLGIIIAVLCVVL